MAVEVEKEPTFKFGKSKVLFKPVDIGLPLGAIFPGTYYDISPDGKRFLMSKEGATTDDESQAEESTLEIPRKFNIVLNWLKN